MPESIANPLDWEMEHMHMHQALRFPAKKAGLVTRLLGDYLMQIRDEIWCMYQL